MISQAAAQELIEFLNYGTIRGQVVADPQSVRFRTLLRSAGAKIAAGDHLLPDEIEAFEWIAVRHLSGPVPHAFDKRTLSWLYNFKPKGKNNRVPIYSHDLLAIYGARHSDERKFPGDFRRCRLEGCGRFFFVSWRRDPAAGGRPADKYCSPECTRKQNDKGGGRRKQNYRDRDKGAVQ